MALLVRLWDDFAKECAKREIQPDWKLFLLWVDGIPPEARKQVMRGTPPSGTKAGVKPGTSGNGMLGDGTNTGGMAGSRPM